MCREAKIDFCRTSTPVNTYHRNCKDSLIFPLGTTFIVLFVWCVPYACHYNPRFVYFLPTFWSSFMYCDIWPYVWLVFKSGLQWRASVLKHISGTPPLSFLQLGWFDLETNLLKYVCAWAKSFTTIKGFHRSSLRRVSCRVNTLLF